jgi:hypothetical protein
MKNSLFFALCISCSNEDLKSLNALWYTAQFPIYNTFKARIDLLSFNTWLKDFSSCAIVKMLIAFT